MNSSKTNILIVDDEKEFADLLAYLLESEGFTVITANDGFEAVERLKSFAPDLILLDLMMPALDGLDTLRAIRETPGLEDTPVMIMSASKEPKCDDLEWEGFISKPFDIDQVLQSVRLALSGVKD